MHWSSESLWAKTQVYVQRAAEEERDGALFAFWSHLAFELLIRASLAHVHPALLADGRPASVLYALGHPNSKEPRSLGAADALQVCVEVIPGFTKKERDAAAILLGRRNRELHTGDPAFEQLPLGVWLADYYRLCQILLRHQGRELEDLFGLEEAVAAEQMIAATQQRVEHEVKELIAGAARAWRRLPSDERRARRAAARAKGRASDTKPAKCPACDTQLGLIGERVATSPARLDGQHELVEEIRLLPTGLDCAACGLRLTGHAELHAAGLGGQFTVLEELDPVDFHAIDIDSYIDPEKYMAIPDGPEYEDE